MASNSTVLSDIHADIIRTHILSRLDGPALGALACASSELRSLSGDDELWRKACGAEWPSVASLSGLVASSSSFPSGHRSLFSDAFAGLDPGLRFDPTAVPTGTLVSAVDIFYDDRLIFSRVKVMEETSEWSRGSPFSVEMLEPKESVVTPIPRRAGQEEENEWMRRLEESVRVSWVVIDAAGGRAGNVSSGSAVRAERHWLTGEVQLKFSTVMTAWGVQCAVGVTCVGGEDGFTHLGEIGLHVEDMDGRHVSGSESVAVLANAIHGGRRCAATAAAERERFDDYLRLRSLARLKRQRRDNAIDMACLLTGLSIFVSFCSFLIFAS